MKIGFAITRAASMDATWTTLHLAHAALLRGHEVRFIEPWDFEIDPRGHLVARAHAFDPPAPPRVETLVDALRRRRAQRRFVDVGRLDLLLLRAAPLDTVLLTFAQIAQSRGVRVVNDPIGVLTVSHKAWLAAQPEVPTPATLVTRSRGAAQVFYEQQPHGVVVKPARGSGGRGVAVIEARDPGALQPAVDLAAACGDGYIVLQQYLPQAEDGEKRLVWLDGDVLGGYLRRRAPGEFRHNLKRGGVAEPTEITAAERAMVARVSPALLAAGIRLAGLDVIGGLLTEVNALNPGGAFHTDRLTGSQLADVIVERLEAPRGERRFEATARSTWVRPAP